MQTAEIITVTKVNEKNVNYSGSQFNGADISLFPSAPEIGKRFILVCDFKSGEQKIIDYPLLYLY